MGVVTNPLDQFDPTPEELVTTAPVSAAPNGNPLDQFDPRPEEMVTTPPVSSRTGAFARAAGSNVLPMAGGLAAAGPAAETGAALGLLGGPFAEATVPIGAAIGGLAGMFGGGYAVSKAQDYVLKSLPDSWREALGQDDRQKQLDEKLHPVPSFLGGTAPWLLTMSPAGAAARALPEGATAFQRILANPVTARIFGGVAMGGMELGQEKLQGAPADWTDVAISTGLGIFFNRPNALGHALTEIGARPVRALLPQPVARPTGQPSVSAPVSPELANDAKIIGPGVTEGVFQGAHEQAPEAAQAAQEAAREQHPTPQPDLHAIAQRMEPETFTEYDNLSAQREALRSHIADIQSPPKQAFDDLKARQDDLNAKLAAHVESRNGYTGGAEARQLRAQIRDTQTQIDTLSERKAAFAAGEGTETADLAAMRQRLMDTDFKMRDLATQVSAAYRRAADAVGAGTVPPEELPPKVSMENAAQLAAEPVQTETQPKASDIAKEVAQRLTEAGRPADEALAAGQLVQAHYETRAARFGGKLGTAADIYRNEGSIIRTGRQKASAEKTVTLYRAESKTRNPIPEWVLQGLRDSGAAVAMGRWFVRDPKMLDFYVNDIGKENVSIRSVQIPESQLEKYKVANISDTIQGKLPKMFSRDPDNEYFLPHELAQQQPTAKELEQTARGKIQLAKGVRPVITLMKNANASTFIHETGHQWLEELGRDAAHEAAPEGLKADAASVLKWLNAKSADDITTRQHEKFARGFEQYMREGIAPSPTLAGVFAKFKNWLTTIYQTLKGLGKPINEDIHSVFDRMLATEPQRTVIAEHTLGPTLTDIHVADELHTEPAEAEPARDRVVAERDRYKADLPPEVQNELQEAGNRQAATAALGGNAGNQAAEPGGEVVPGQGGSSEVEQNSNRQGAIAGSSSGSGQLGKIEPSGSETGGEGARLPAGAGQRSPVEQLAPKPAPFLDTQASPFTDKAGNIRLDTLTTSEDVKSAIRDAAAENKDFIGDTQGKVTDGQVMELADALGMDFEQINRRKIGQAFNAVQVMAARKLLIQSATAVSEVMKRAATGTDEDVMAYAEAKSRHQMIQGQVAGITAEAGRALRAFRNIAGQEATQNVDQFIRSATGKTLYQMREEAKLGAVLDSTHDISKFARDTTKRSFGRMLLEFLVNNYISGLATHATYVVANGMLETEHLLLINPAAAVLGEVRARVFGYQGERVRLGEVPAGFAGLWRGLPPAIKAVGQAIRTGVTARLPGDTSKYALPFQPRTELVTQADVDMKTTWHALASDLYSMMRGAPNAIMAYGKLLQAGAASDAPIVGAKYSPLGAIPDIAYRGTTIIPLGTVARLPSRMVAAIHSLFNVLDYSVDVAQRSYRQAAAEGHTGEAFAARVADLNQNPPPEIMEPSVSKAKDLTLMGRSGDFMQRVSRLVNWEVNLPVLGNTQPLRFIDPFVHIAGQISKQSVYEQTPLGLTSLLNDNSEFGADLRGRNGVAAKDLAVAKITVGTSLAIAAASYAAQDMLTGAGPSTPQERADWQRIGKQAYSVRIGDFWYAYHRLGALGFLMGAAADMHDVAVLSSKEEMSKAAGRFLTGFVQNYLDEGFMAGPANLFKAIENPDREGERYISNFLSSFIPYSVGLQQMTRALDPYQRETRSILDAMKAHLPWISQSLYPRRDIWGEPMLNLPSFGGRAISAVYESKISNDPVNLALHNLSIFPAPVDRTIRNVELTDQQYDDYARIAGRMAKQRLDVLVSSPDFKNFSAYVQADTIRAQVKASRESAAGIIMMNNPDIVQQAYKAKAARFAPASE